MEDWDSLGLNPLPPMSARTRIERAPAPVQVLVDQRLSQVAHPFVGVTTDGKVIDGLFSSQPTGIETRSLSDAASAFVEALTPEQRQRAVFAMDANEWRLWINVHMNHFRHGVMLEDLDATGRRLGLGLLRATLSDHGYHQARTIMRINQFVVDLGADGDSFGEWPYFVSIFGDPGGGAPWGFQFDGHHLNVNVVVIDDRVVVTPQFMGTEPRRIRTGPLAGTALFDDEEQDGIDLIRSLDAAQRARAITRPSIMREHLPAELNDPFDGRVMAGAQHDNAVLPYEGIAGADMTDAQRAILTRVIAAYADRVPRARAALTMADVTNHLDSTWFQWFGGTSDHDAFYYRIHGPVMLIEFDHHPGVVFDNRQPTRNHIHTLVRTPNGGDYGRNLIAEHYAQFDHSHGTHQPHH